MMSRRPVSPIRRVSTDITGPAYDERDFIIKKLKEELILGRNKEKEVVIVENYLIEIEEKIRIVSEELIRKEGDCKGKVESCQKMIHDLRREIEVFKADLKNKSIDLGEHEAHLLEIKRHLTKRTSELEKLKKETLYLNDEHELILHENDTSFNRYEDGLSEVKRIESTNKSYQDRLAEVNSKIREAKNFICELTDESRLLKDKLRQHEQENNKISDDLNVRQENIDDLEKVFASEHDQIKNHIDSYIEMQHKNERILTEIRHQINLSNTENDKTVELTTTKRTFEINLEKQERTIANVLKEQEILDEEVKKYQEANSDYEKYNNEMVQDLGKCQIHYQNLMKYNSHIQEQLEKYLCEDEHIISIIKRKRAVDLVPMKESRRISDRTYI